MLTQAFQEGVEELLEVARQKRTVILCAKGLFWQCHRRLVRRKAVEAGEVVVCCGTRRFETISHLRLQ
jgi:hypothetical protein